MTRKQRRLTLIGVAGVVLACAAGLVLYAMSDRIVFFNSPSDLAERFRRRFCAPPKTNRTPITAWWRCLGPAPKTGPISAG